MEEITVTQDIITFTEDEIKSNRILREKRIKNQILKCNLCNNYFYQEDYIESEKNCVVCQSQLNEIRLSVKGKNIFQRIFGFTLEERKKEIAKKEAVAPISLLNQEKTIKIEKAISKNA